MNTNWNGFYNLKNLSNETLKQLFQEALDLSKDSHVDIILPGKFVRTKHNSVTPQMFIDKILNSKLHNVFINRSISSHGLTEEGEVGSHTFDTNLFLFIYLSLENLELLAKKYQLSRKLF